MKGVEKFIRLLNLNQLKLRVIMYAPLCHLLLMHRFVFFNKSRQYKYNYACNMQSEKNNKRTKKNFKETVINQVFYAAKARSSFFIHNWAVLLSLPLYFQSMQLYFFFQWGTSSSTNSSKELVLFFHILLVYFQDSKSNSDYFDNLVVNAVDPYHRRRCNLIPLPITL